MRNNCKEEFWMKVFDKIAKFYFSQVKKNHMQYISSVHVCAGEEMVICKNLSPIHLMLNLSKSCLI